MQLFNKFFKDNDGAVTVDWVVLTSAIIGIALAIVTTLAPGVNNVGDHTSEALVSIKDRVGDGTVLD